MTNKTTPEKIALVVLKDQIHNNHQFYAIQPFTGHVDEALVYQEYIRADLAPQSSTSEHLEEGEYQWVRLEDKECPWELAQAVYDPFISSDMLLDVDGKTYNFDDVAEFGPVIQPPPDQSN